MQIKKEELAKYQALQKELETTILKKLEAVKQKVLMYNAPTLGENIQILTIVSDELDDVLLNWEASALPGIRRDSFGDYDDFDEDDD